MPELAGHTGPVRQLYLGVITRAGTPPVDRHYPRLQQLKIVEKPGDL